MNKIMILPLIFSLNALLSMDNNSEQSIDLTPKETNCPSRKELFFEWYGHGPIGTKERWECLKKGVKEGAIYMTPVEESSYIEGKHYYLAYSEKVNLNNSPTRFMYPSPNNPYSGYLIEDTGVLWTIDEGGTGSLLVNAQWNTNRGIDNEAALPIELHPPQEYFPDWKNNKNLWVYNTTIKQLYDITKLRKATNTNK